MRLTPPATDKSITNIDPAKSINAKSITNIDLVKSIYGKSITRKSQMTQDAEDCDTDVKMRRCTQR